MVTGMGGKEHRSYSRHFECGLACSLRKAENASIRASGTSCTLRHQRSEGMLLLTMKRARAGDRRGGQPIVQSSSCDELAPRCGAMLDRCDTTTLITSRQEGLQASGSRACPTPPSPSHAACCLVVLVVVQ
jgi:hypothetical protein